MKEKENNRKDFWKSLSKLDWVALAVCAVGVWAALPFNPLREQQGFGLLRLLGTIAGVYLFYRFWSRWRSQIMWSLRNRLIVAYLFVAVVPILLLLILAS